MRVQELFDEATFTLTYVVWDEATRDAVVIDSVLDYEPVPSRITTRSADRINDCVERGGLKVRAILETHAHADHLTAAQLLRQRYDAPVLISERITKVQAHFHSVFDCRTDGDDFDRLLLDHERFNAGSLEIVVLPTPGHTPACSSYLIEDAVFTGDALFIEDYGTGRTDFPGGSAVDLYRSVHELLYSLPSETRVFTGHDYQPGGRPMRCATTIGASRRSNVQLRAETSEAAFVEFRNKRDATLSPPRLLFQSLQVNLAAGALPARHFAIPFTTPPDLRLESSAWSRSRLAAVPPARRAVAI